MPPTLPVPPTLPAGSPEPMELETPRGSRRDEDEEEEEQERAEHEEHAQEEQEEEEEDLALHLPFSRVRLAQRSLPASAPN